MPPWHDAKAPGCAADRRPSPAAASRPTRARATAAPAAHRRRPGRGCPGRSCPWPAPASACGAGCRWRSRPAACTSLRNTGRRDSALRRNSRRARRGTWCSAAARAFRRGRRRHRRRRQAQAPSKRGCQQSSRGWGATQVLGTPAARQMASHRPPCAKSGLPMGSQMKPASNDSTSKTAKAASARLTPGVIARLPAGSPAPRSRGSWPAARSAPCN